MCSSCGQKYKGLSGNRAHKNLTRYRRLRGGKKEIVSSTSTVTKEPEQVSTEEKKESNE